jgi:hypothetical protein
MTTSEDIQNIKDIAFQGVGLGILAGVTMQTMKIVEKSVHHNKRRNKKYKYGNAYNYSNYWIK